MTPRERRKHHRGVEKTCVRSARYNIQHANYAEAIRSLCWALQAATAAECAGATLAAETIETLEKNRGKARARAATERHGKEGKSNG